MVLAYVCALSTGFSNARLVQIPSIKGLPAPHPLAISADGKTVVGQFAPGNPFTWRGGETARFRPSSNPDILDQYAQAVSSDGKVIVGRAGGAYVWTRNKSLKMLGDASTFAYGVSESGNEVICQVEGKPNRRGFLWSAAGTINFDSFSPTCISGNGKAAAGIQTEHGSVRAFEFRNQVAQELVLPDVFTDSSAYAINRDGTSIVGIVFNDKVTSAALWRNSKFIKLADLGQTVAVAKTICRDGSFIGGYIGNEAAIWTPDGKATLLEAILKNSGASTSGWKFESINGLTRVGKTVYATGWAHRNGKEAGYWVSFRTK